MINRFALALGMLCMFRHNYKRYSLESRLHFRIHAANDKLKRINDGSQTSLNWENIISFC